MSVSRNTFYNLLGALLPLGTAIVTVPLYIKLIGEGRYGVLAIAWLLLGYFGVFDLGLGRATAQRIAVLKYALLRQRANTFWTALILNGTFGIIGGLLIWPVAHIFFVSHFKIEEVLRPEIVSAAPWLAIAVPMATVSGVFTGALQGIEKFLVLNTVSAVGSVLFQLLPLLVAWVWSPGLDVLLPVAIFSRFLTLWALFLLCKKHIFQSSKIAYLKEEAKYLLSFGGWVTVSAFISPIMVMVDRFITGSTLGAQYVAYYTVPYQLAERTTILPTALASSLFPQFATLQPSEERQVAVNALKTLIVIMTPLSILAMLLAKPFLSTWISEEFSQQSSSVAILLLAGFWVNGLARIPHAQLQAKGRPDIVAKCHLIEITPYLLMLYVGIHYFGIAGAALIFSARLYADFLLLTSFSGILKEILWLKLGAMALIAAVVYHRPLAQAIGVHWAVVAALIFAVASSWSFAYAPESLMRRLRKCLKK